ncbi:MAG: GAF domain-containing protein [Fimbriimonadia bacterium]|jgi:signal transduction histidine kinase
MYETTEKYASLITELDGSPEIRSFLDRISEAAIALTDADNALVAVVDYFAGVLRIEGGAGADWDESKRSVEIGVGDDRGLGITAYVAASRQPYNSGDVTADAHYRSFVSSTRSELALPIVDNHDRLRGVLNVESDKGNAFSDQHIALLKPLAALCELALQLGVERGRQEAFISMGHVLASDPDEETLLHEVLRIAAEMLAFEACSIFVWSSEARAYVLRATRGDLEGQVGTAMYTDGEGLTGKVAETGTAIRLANPTEHPDWRGKYLEMPAEEISAFLAVPIPGRDRMVGVMRVLRRRRGSPWIDNSFTANNERVLAALAALLGSGLGSIRAVRRLVQSERMAAWGEMSARSAHMIGNRAFAIQGDLNELRYVIEQPNPDMGAIRDLVNSLSANLDRLEEILSEFRDFVKATHLALDTTDINELVRSTLAEMFPKRTAIELKVSLQEDLPPVQCDAGKMRRVVSEIIENALHFQESGTFRVSTALAEEQDFRSARMSTPGRPYVKLVFEDEGPGVPADMKLSIFDPFRTSRVKGMGLGLSIAKGIVDAHGGRLYEDGVPGTGARFVILLPVGKTPERKAKDV